MFVKKVEDEIDDFFNDLKRALRGKDLRIKYLEEQNCELHDEAYKDKELTRMKATVNEMEEDYYRGFPISQEEQDKIDEWREIHEKEVHNCHNIDEKLRRAGCIGGTYTYEFTPTSIGTIGLVKCSCGARFTFQDI